MSRLMRNFIPDAVVRSARTELRLRLADGSPWILQMSPGTERFIGHYPRLPGIEADGPVLT